MKGYLLDTNAICDWLDETKSRHAIVSQKAEQAAQDRALIVTSSIVLGEIEHGVVAVRRQGKGLLSEFRAQVDRQFVQKRLLLNVSPSTALVYGDLRARLFEVVGPRSKRKRERLAEQLTHPVSSKELGIQENDLWIAAQAIERNLILVTNDAMSNIQKIAPELRVEDWAAAES